LDLGTEPHKDSDASTNQQFFEQYTQISITRLNDGSYCAKLPWRENRPPLPSNYSVCLQITGCLAKCLAQTPGLLQLMTASYKIKFIEGSLSRWTYLIQKKENSITSHITVYRRTLLLHPSESCMIVAATNLEAVLSSMTVYHSA